MGELTKDEKSLLLFLETRAVDNGGIVDGEKMNTDDFATARKWTESRFLAFGRIKHSDLSVGRTHWVVLSEAAWVEAHRERRERFTRIESTLKVCRLGKDAG